MEGHPIEGLMSTAMNSIREMIDVNTIIGNPIQSSNSTTIVPVSKVSFGFASGGTEFNSKDNCNKKISIEKNNNKDSIEKNKEKYPFGGGSGAAVSINPIGFLVIQNDNVKLVPIEHDNAWDKLFDYVPDAINKVNGVVDKLINKKEKEKSENSKNDKNNEKISYEIKYDNQGNTVSENVEIEDE